MLPGSQGACIAVHRPDSESTHCRNAIMPDAMGSAESSRSKVAPYRLSAVAFVYMSTGRGIQAQRYQALLRGLSDGLLFIRTV